MQTILFVATNHGKLTEAQILDAQKSLGVTHFVYLVDIDPDLSKKIANIPAMATSDEVADLANQVVKLAEKSNAHFLLVAGEPLFVTAATLLAENLVQGVSFDLVKSLLPNPSDKSDFSRFRKIEVVQSTTERESVESTTDGKVVKTSVFVHKQWRRNLLGWLPSFV